ncbi:RNA-directed DNA polymerase, eukaryota, partial [Tanacetum coccineum]
MMHSFRSNADHTRLISKSIFINNFPDSTTSKDLWNLCHPYGTVVDVFILNRKSKSGKRFAFIRFIKIDNIDRLVGNLCTLWIGRFHLLANVVRFDRPSKYASRSSHPVNPKPANHVSPVATSFVLAVKGNSSPFVSKPALVLDESCLVTRDLGYFVMGGLWVMIELESTKTKLNLMNHVGVASWFRSLCNAQSDFIGSKWGDVLELEDDHNDLFARKRLCIKTKHEENILESFKIIVKGKVFCVRAKGLFVWNPTFKYIPEAVHCSDDESIKGEAEMNGEDSKLNNDGDASDSEVVSDTYFGDNADEQGYENEQGQSFNAKEVSKDPFNIYDLLNKTKKVIGTSGSDTSLPYPPGFTPNKSTNVINEKEVSDAAEVRSNSKSDGVRLLGIQEIPNQLKLLVISVYAPQSLSSKKMLWSYISSLIVRWNGECLVMGDFNEVRCKEERWGSTFNAHGANVFNTFILSSGLIDVQLEG